MDSVQLESKYNRTGYISDNTKTDVLLKLLLSKLPCDGYLPSRWRYQSHEYFMRKYSSLGAGLWSASFNCHVFMLNGFHVLRMWTDTEAASWIELNDQVASVLATNTFSPVVDIPAGNAKKSKPFKKRIKVYEQFHILEIVKAVENIYGLRNASVRVSQYRM